MVFDALTYGGGLANLEGLSEGRVELVVGDIYDAVGSWRGPTHACISRPRLRTPNMSTLPALRSASARTYGVRATVSNSSNNYGPRQHPEKFIPRQVAGVLLGGRPAVYGDGSAVRDWIHVDDHSSAVWAILARGRIGESYLVGGAGGERSNADVARAVLSVMGRDPEGFDLVADQPGHDRRYAVDSSKLREELGWRPAHADFEAGLRGAIAWYRDNEAWWASAKREAEEMYARKGE